MPMLSSLSVATHWSTSLGTSWTLWVELALVLERPLGREGLGGEAHVHDAGRVAVGGGEVDQAAFAEDVEPSAVGLDVFVDEFADLVDVGFGHFREVVEGEFDVEVAGVADHRAVLHDGEVLAADDVDVAGDGDEKVADLAAASPWA